MPVKVLAKDGKLTGIQCIRMELGEPDDSGRRRPSPVKGSEFDMPLDSVIVAIGQALDRSALPGELRYTDEGNVAVDAVTLETNIKGVFAGGDSVSGPASVIEAVAAGKRAAESIARYLKNEDMRLSRFEDTIKPVPEELLPVVTDREKKPRAVPENLPVEQRLGNFTEIEGGLTEEAALAECERCLNCALCSECLECVQSL